MALISTPDVGQSLKTLYEAPCEFTCVAARPLARALHADVRFLAEPGRSLVQCHHPEGDQAVDVQECQRTDHQDPGLRRQLQPTPEAVHLDSNGSLNFREDQTTYSTYLLDATLEPRR